MSNKEKNVRKVQLKLIKTLIYIKLKKRNRKNNRKKDKFKTMK